MLLGNQIIIMIIIIVISIILWNKEQGRLEAAFAQTGLSVVVMPHVMLWPLERKTTRIYGIPSGWYLSVSRMHRYNTNKPFFLLDP